MTWRPCSPPPEHQARRATQTARKLGFRAVLFRVCAAPCPIRDARRSERLTGFRSGPRGGLKALLFDQGIGLRAGQEADQCLCGGGRFSALRLPDREGGDLLVGRRNFADEIDAGDRQQLADLLETDFDVAARDPDGDPVLDDFARLATTASPSNGNTFFARWTPLALAE